MNDLPSEATGGNASVSPMTSKPKESGSAMTSALTNAEDTPSSIEEAEFLTGLRTSVKQANSGQVTPIRPVLEKLRAKYGDGE